MNTHTLLGILSLPHVGRSTLKEVIEWGKRESIKINFDLLTIQGIFENIHQTNKRVKIPTKADFNIACRRLEEVEMNSSRNGIVILSVLDDAFPSLLREIPDYPVILHCKGNVEAFREKCVAVIGTREPTDHGRQMGARLTEVFVERDFTIVSGLAVGCDTVAHETAVQKKGMSIGILANGLQDVYPRESRKLAEKMLETGGLLLSEYEFGKTPTKNFFIERDRLQSGISEGVLVIETAMTGGTRHTVNFAIQQHKPVGCLYTHIDPKYNMADSEKFQGNKDIVENHGGIPLYSKDSIDAFLKNLEMLYAAKESNAAGDYDGRSLSGVPADSGYVYDERSLVVQEPEMWYNTNAAKEINPIVLDPQGHAKPVDTHKSTDRKVTRSKKANSPGTPKPAKEKKAPAKKSAKIKKKKGQLPLDFPNKGHDS